MVDAQPSTSVRKLSNRELCTISVCIMPVQTLKPDDYASRLKFSRLIRNRRLCQKILFSDKPPSAETTSITPAIHFVRHLKIYAELENSIFKIDFR